MYSLDISDKQIQYIFSIANNKSINKTRFKKPHFYSEASGNKSKLILPIDDMVLYQFINFSIRKSVLGIRTYLSCVCTIFPDYETLVSNAYQVQYTLRA